MAGDPPTDPLYVALGAALAAIEAGTIAEAEVESRRVQGDDETLLTVTVRKTVRPMIATGDD